MKNKFLIAVILIFLVYSAVSKVMKSDSETFSEIYYQTVITLAEYEAVKPGMTYDKVCEILYGEGIMITETDLGAGLAYEQIYMWEGSGLIGASVKITFRNGKVTEKDQIGLL